MRETKFIEQNREKWQEFEDMLRENHRDPEKLNDLFTVGTLYYSSVSSVIPWEWID